MDSDLLLLADRFRGWPLLVLLVGTWLVELAASVAALQADILKGRRPPDAGVSLFPGLPVVPLGFWGISYLIDLAVAPWGTLLVGGVHLVLALLFLVVLVVNVLAVRREVTRRHEGQP